MKSLLLATATAVGLGVLGLSGASAAPVNGAAIGQAATSDLTQKARVVIVEHRRHHHHCVMRYHPRRLVCWR